MLGSCFSGERFVGLVGSGVAVKGCSMAVENSDGGDFGGLAVVGGWLLAVGEDVDLGAEASTAWGWELVLERFCRACANSLSDLPPLV